MLGKAERIVRQTHRMRAKSAVLALGVLLAVVAPHSPRAQTTGASTPGSLPVPRYVSLKPSKVNLRSGPGTDYPTVWVYKREGLPLEVIKEFEGWRQVRDAEGASGWVLQSFLSGRRTALVQPWEVKAGVPAPQTALYGDSSERATLIAKVEAGVIANIISCDGTWCWVSVDQFKGYVQQKNLWGVYEAEVVK